MINLTRQNMSNQLILVPIEPLDERYTASWYRNLPKAFAEQGGYDVTVIDGQVLVDNDIKVGTFLDINSTCHYKATQLQQIAEMFHGGEVKDGATFFFSDLEFWGIEQIRLLADMNGIKVKLFGFLHAASYTKGDAFAIAAPYQQYTELGWIAAMDKVFVGSEYHKRIVINRRLKPLGAMHLAKKIVVTKNPMFQEDYPKFKLTKKRRMLLTNRFDKEKNPHHTMALFRRLKQLYPTWEFIVTTGRKTFRGNNQAMIDEALEMERQGIIKIKAGLTKEQYHRELAQAAIVVSHSREESYGLCVAESIIYGCMPLLYCGAAHPEFVQSLPIREGSQLLFTKLSPSNGPSEATDFVRAQGLINAFEHSPKNEWREFVPQFDWSGVSNIIHHMKNPGA